MDILNNFRSALVAARGDQKSVQKFEDRFGE